MASLVRVALELLEDPDAAPGLRSVACTTLLAALTAGIEVPPAAPVVIWRWLLVSEQGASALHLHELASSEVARDALWILTTDPDAGEDARDLAMAALRGENLAAVTAADLLLLADGVLNEGRTRRFTFLVEGVHELNGLSPDFLKMLRDRLALSSLASVRAAGVEVGALLPRLDDYFTERMLLDTSPIVRRVVLEVLERVEVPDRAKAAAIVRKHLGSTERHRTVIAAGLSALGALVKREPEAN